MKFDGVRQKVFLDRYALKGEDGELIEHTPEEMWARVAKGIAINEKKSKRAHWEKEFYRVLEDFKFVPGGRILSGAGTGYQVTYFNCFVIPSPKDSRHGILESLGQLIEIQSRSGGVGLNLSSLRPRGARVKKVNGTSSGPVNWATLFSVATHDIVQQGGSRRGATMLMLWDWHPDIEEFITVKQDVTKINGANLSVCVSDAFMEAVKADSSWDLVYPDLSDPNYDRDWDGDLTKWKANGGKVTVYRTVQAKALWDLICTAAWRSAEPGLHFLDRSNKRSNTWYFENLVATNPCLPADAWIQTSSGPKQVKDLLGKPFVARVDGGNYLSTQEGFFQTGTKELVRLQTKEGYALRLTADHKLRRIKHVTRYTCETEWCESSDLKQGDTLLLNDHSSNPSWKGSYTFNDGYLMGLLVGDGTLKSDKAVLSVWETNSLAIGQSMSGAQSIMHNVMQMTTQIPHRSDFSGWMPVSGRNEHRLALSYVKQLALSLGMSEGNKRVTEAVEKTSSDFYCGFLRGFFDADGSVQGSQKKGVSVRLSQSDEVSLSAVQRMLLRLGIASTLYKERRVKGEKLLPNGKGGNSLYAVKAQHELVISGENLSRFHQLVGFGDVVKAEKLSLCLDLYQRKLNRERFIVRVDSVVSDGKEAVYDATIPEVHEFDANGFHAHNCGEQPLGPWAVCNLGAMNLSAYVHGDDLSNDKAGVFDYESFGNDVKVAMRFLDNVIDQTYYFFKENELSAKNIRRTGLGIMGLGDAMIKMQVKYGSEESLPIIEKIFKTLRDSAYDASSDLAEEKGAFPKFEKEQYLKGYHVKALPASLRKKIAEQGIRNAVLLTVAPTGTTSLVSGVSSGIEPVYEFVFKRRWRGGEETMYHHLLDEWKLQHPEEDRPGYFVSANDLTPSEHAKVQAVAQDYIDSSISKTVNGPKTDTVDDVKNLYMMAYDMGLKGITYFRDGCREGVLERIEEKKPEEKKEPVVVVPAEPIIPVTPRMPRPMMLTGVTYKADSPTGKLYITINNDEKGDLFEVFINHGKSGSDLMALADALGRMVSFVLRIHSPVPARERVREIISELAGIGGSRSSGFGENRVRSLPDAISKVLARHCEFRVNGKVEDSSLFTQKLNNAQSQLKHVDAPIEDVIANQLALPETGVESGASTSLFDICPECGSGSFAYEEGCKKCYGCGYSEC
jgi:ribonucleoside-diphosphate reductase alpha chain